MRLSPNFPACALFALGLSLFFGLGAAPSLAQAASLFDLGDRYFESFDELEILDGDIVMDIEQDSSGYIWLATQKGLFRYDGYEFRPHKHDENDASSISGNFIRDLLSVGGTLWIGTNSDGISIYDPLTERFTRIKHDPANEQSLADNDVWSMAESRGSVVVATRSGIGVFSLASRELSRVAEIRGCEFLLEDGRLASIVVNESDLFIGSFHGLCRIRLASQSLLQPIWKGEEVTALRDQRVFNLDLLRDGELWIATRNSGMAVLELETNSVRWVLVDASDPERLATSWIDDTALVDGLVWAGTVGSGVAIIDPDSLKVVEHIVYQAANPSGLSLNDVSAVFTDDAGIVWLGTWGAGLNRYNPASRAFKILRQNPFVPASLGDSHIQSLKEMQNGDVWLGTALSGVQVVRPGVGLVRRFESVPGDSTALQTPFIHSIEQLPGGEIWIGSNQTGVYRYNEATDDFTQFTTEQGLTDDLVRTAYATGDILWLGTDAGLTRVDTRTETFEAVRLEASPRESFDNLIGAIIRFGDDLWVGTNDGLFVIPGGDGALRPVLSNPQAPLADNYVADLAVDSKGKLWIATAQGLNILESWDGKTASFLSVNQKLGLPPQPLGEALEEDSLGRIWAQAHLIEPRDWSYTRINRDDGWDVGNTWIGSNGKLRDGTILFGGTRGLLMLRPEEYRRSAYPSRVVVTRGELDSEPLTLAQMSPLVLPAETKSFSIEFAALNYASSNQLQYRYRLEGYDDEWVATAPRNRRATYSRLPPGDYVLRIDVADEGVATNDSSIAIPLTQLPSWYETNVFRVAVALLAAVSLYLLYRNRVARLQRQKRNLDRLVSERTDNIRQLAQAGQDITATLDLDRVVASIQRHVSALMDTSVFTVGLLRPDGETVDARFHFQDGQRIEGFERSLADAKSPAVWALKARRVLSVSSDAELKRVSPAFRQIKRPRRVESSIFHPLIVDEKLIGFLGLQSYEKNAYGENELQMLKTLAAYAAVAIDNAESLRQLNAAKEEIERVSLTDQLTGLSNRRFLDKVMPAEVARIHRSVGSGTPERLGLLLIDADHFKQVNDTYGHDAGDRVLKQLAGILKSTCREMDWTVRLGGEEFLVVARVNSRDQLLSLAERIRQNVAAHTFDLGSGISIAKTCSIGVCHLPFVEKPITAMSWEQTVGIADQALYLAKGEGRDRWVALFGDKVKEPQPLSDSGDDFLSLINSGEVVAIRSGDGTFDAARLLAS